MNMPGDVENWDMRDQEEQLENANLSELPVAAGCGEFTVRIRPEEDGQFVATSDSLKYFSAHGLTPDDALREYAIALSGALEVMREDGQALL